MAGFSDVQLQKIVDNYYSHGSSQCPECSTQLKINESQSVSLPKYFFVRCPRCGITGQIRDDKWTNAPRWDTNQKKQIEDDYWRNNSARCPIDNAPLTVEEINVKGDLKTYLMVICPRCTNDFCTKP